MSGDRGSSPDLPLTGGVALGKSLCFFSTVSFLTHIGSPHKPLWTLYPGTILENIGKGAEIWKTKFTSKILKKTKDTISTRIELKHINCQVKILQHFCYQGKGKFMRKKQSITENKEAKCSLYIWITFITFKIPLYLLPRLKGT